MVEKFEYIFNLSVKVLGCDIEQCLGLKYSSPFRLNTIKKLDEAIEFCVKDKEDSLGIKIEYFMLLSITKVWEL